jgi:ATP-binding cassette subfamily B protein/subfamily B ATP-binding cassette protein MsbA
MRRFFLFLCDLPRIRPYLRPYRTLALVTAMLVGLSALTGLLTPWPLAILVDSVLGRKPLPAVLGSFLDSWSKTGLLVFAVLAGLIVTALQNGIAVAQEYVNTKLEQRLALDFRSDLFEHLQRLSPAFHDSAQVGGLMFTFTKQADSIGRITLALPPLVQSLATLVGMFVIAYRIDPELALLSMTVVPFIYYLTGQYTLRIAPRLVAVRDLEHQQFSLAQEAFSMLRVIVAFGREPFEYRRLRMQGETAVDARVNLTLRQTLFSLRVEVITAAGTALVLGFGGAHALHGALTPGELLVVMSYVAAVYAPLQQISYTLTTLQDEFISFRGALELLETKPEIADPPNAIDLRSTSGAVSFEGVSFAYPTRERTLEDVSFEITSGARVGIVGRTGAGKTTLVNLIMRLYDPSEGRVLLDGNDLRTLSVSSLRRQVGLVLQEPMLFSGSIEANIRYGRLEASAGEIVEAARAANAHDFITELPQGYETLLGERGAQLSGGERQRISIARAFLKDAPILVLDEPTASIDVETEAEILESLERLMRGRTTIVISHRLSVVRDADLILVVDDGRIVEQGSHEQLLELGGMYASLHGVADDADLGRMEAERDGTVWPAASERVGIRARS